jgi:hypothetical protein
MKKQVFTFVLIGLLSTLTFVSCGDNNSEEKFEKPTQAQLKIAIREMEDSLKNLQVNKIPVENLHRLELVNRLLAYYQNYPEDAFSANCLDNAHMVYSGLGAHERSMAYADTLLTKYPKYSNREMILESQGSNYDIFAQPRDTAKVRYYYELLLKEYPMMDAEKREGIKERLKYIHLDFDAYLDQKIGQMAIK